MLRPSKIRAAVVVISILLARRASAEPPHLEASADLGCPSAEDLRRAIAERLGADDFDRADSPSVLVHVRRTTDGALSADVSVTTSLTSARTIDGADSCADLLQAVALSVALAIEHEAPPPPPPPAPEPAERAAPSPPLRSDRATLGADAVTTVGLTPSPAIGVGVHARYRLGGVALSARGFWLPASDMPNNDFRMRFFAAGAGACVESKQVAGMSALGCGHLMGGAYGVISAATPLRDDSGKAYIGASASIGGRARVAGPLGVEVMVDGELPFTKPEFLTSTCPARGFASPFVAVAAWIGASVTIF